LTPVIINISQLRVESKTGDNYIKNLETVYNIPNRNAEGKYDFTNIEIFKDNTSSE
jgi:hypothetical protein